MKPLLLRPIPDKTIWGTDHISKARGYDEPFGTWWEVSAHPYCTNEIINLPGETLQSVIDADPENILGPGLTLHECLRLAWLDTKDRLSIQVHPTDDNAPENDYGKSESWYVLDAAPGATLVAGTNTTDAETIRKSIEDGTLEDYLVHWPVKAGDFIYIPAGMLHALGKDICAIEVGTNSNTTYRFYDYKRKGADGKERPLHLEESFKVTDFSLQPAFVPASNEDHILADAPQFTVVERFINEPRTFTAGNSYFILSNMGEEIQFDYDGETITLPKYSSVFVPWSAKEVTLPAGHVLESRPKL